MFRVCSSPESPAYKFISTFHNPSLANPSLGIQRRLRKGHAEEGLAEQSFQNQNTWFQNQAAAEGSCPFLQYASYDFDI